jgi:Fur family transcriptional regulator, ferric uptake regulator
MPSMARKFDTESAKLRLKEATGQRVTEPRTKVLALLTAADRALSHVEIEASLGAQAFDRVTLYRVLDWLVKEGMAHRVSGSDRVWRFSISGKEQGHAHFECRACGKVQCLGDVRTDELPMRVPRGYRAEEIGVTVRGRCASCTS